MDVSVTEVVRHWGVCNDHGEIAPRRLTDFQDELERAVMGIPAKYLDTAEIDFEPDSEYGEYYAAVRITYERPETPEETTARLGDERAHWNAQLANARERVAYCAAQLDALPVKRRV